MKPGSSSPLAFGSVLMAVGILGFVFAGAWRMWQGESAPGELPAIALVLIFVGLVANHPKLLRDDTAAVSSMRVVMFGLFCVFAVLTVKAGWNAQDIGGLNIGAGWAALLGAAMGGKAVQSFSEPTKPKDEPPPPPTR